MTWVYTSKMDFLCTRCVTTPHYGGHHGGSRHGHHGHAGRGDDKGPGGVAGLAGATTPTASANGTPSKQPPGSKLETSYFTFGGFDWNLSIVPLPKDGEYPTHPWISPRSMLK